MGWLGQFQFGVTWSVSVWCDLVSFGCACWQWNTADLCYCCQVSPLNNRPIGLVVTGHQLPNASHARNSNTKIRERVRTPWITLERYRMILGPLGVRSLGVCRQTLWPTIGRKGVCGAILTNCWQWPAWARITLQKQKSPKVTTHPPTRLSCVTHPTRLRDGHNSYGLIGTVLEIREEGFGQEDIGWSAFSDPPLPTPHHRNISVSFKCPSSTFKDWPLLSPWYPMPPDPI